jgi:long-chain acyl-CoA synthetase
VTRPRAWEVHYPPDLDWGAPIAQSTLNELLDRAVSAYDRHPAIEFRGRTITYAELGRRVERLARGLAGLGIEAGDAVALLLPNTPAHPISFFAIARLGARVVHLTPLDPARAVTRKLADSGAQTLITTNLPGALPQAVQAWREGACARLIVADDREWGEPSAALPVPEGVLGWAGLDGPAREWPALAPADVALLQYTGGTTGLPRAAMLTHGNLTATVGIYNAWNRGLGRPFGPGDRMMCVLPLFHIYALTSVMLRVLDNGAELLLRQRFDADAALADIEQGGCTHFYGVPTMWIALVDHPRIATADLSSLRVCSSGGAALPAEIAGRFTELTGMRLGGGWGMTETSPAGTNLLPDRTQEPGEIGVPLPGIDMEVVALDDRRLVLPPGEVGELRIRGPNVTPGYWNREEENARAFVDGWFLTGDIGRMSRDGVFTIVDRKKDMLICGGFNVYPRAIEDAIHEHPDVREAAVIGVPDPYRGQAAKAYVALRAGAPELTLDALREFLADKLGRHELPAALEVRAELPHTPVGKLAKRELIAEIEAQEANAHG